jgi:hypothetical protein
LKTHAIKLSLKKYPASTPQDYVELYKLAFVYTDIRGDKARITSESDLEDVSRHFKEKDEVKIFAYVENMKVEQESPTLESATQSSTETVHSAISITTPQTHEMSNYCIKLALAGSGGKKDDHSHP